LVTKEIMGVKEWLLVLKMRKSPLINRIELLKKAVKRLYTILIKWRIMLKRKLTRTFGMDVLEKADTLFQVSQVHK